MLEEHQSKSGIFGIMSFSTSRSFNSTRRNLDSSHTDAAQHSPQRQALVEQAHKPEMVQAGTTSPRQRTARSQRSHQSSDSQKKKRLEILTTGVVAATASSARLAKSPPETQFSQLKNKCEFK